MKTSYYLIILLFCSLFFCCKKNDAGTPPANISQKSSEKQIISFSFLKANNPSLIADITGAISGTNISLSVPAGTSKTLTATFTNSTKSQVYISTVLQQSSITSNDFSVTINYTVVAEDSSITTYVVKVIFQPKSTEKSLISFSFLKALNSSIPSDITGTVSNTNVSLTVPPSMIRNNLIGTFTNSDKSKVYIGTTLQESGITPNNFSTAVSYKVIAEDSSIAIYLINLVADTFPEFDNLMANVLTNYNVQGIQATIVKNEKLIFTKSYGYADVENNQRTNNDNLFRIASISKPITAITILKLAQDGLLSLTQKVFGTNAILGNSYGTPPTGSKIDQITVKNLLDHTSGWIDDPTDPLFYNLNWDFTQLITDLVQNRPLRYNPGDTSIYSNFGYCVLGRVIEKVTGMSYDQYVKTTILQNCGVSQMKIGGSTLADRFPNEVKYYTNIPFSPYSMNIPRLDACAGWIASATDLARFITRIDRETYRPDILTNTTLQQMYFGFSTWIFYGGLSGTNTVIARLDNNFSFIVLFNNNIGSQMNVVSQMVADIIHQRQTWPTYDLF